MKNITIYLSTINDIIEITDTIITKFKKYFVPDLTIDCPYCGLEQNYELNNLKEGFFTKYYVCENCNRKIKIDIEVIVNEE
jgi:DNA-directed RNA polymerase subunit RPC12/RpoP